MRKSRTGRKVLLSCPKNYSDCGSEKLGLKDKTSTAVKPTPIIVNLIHLGQQGPCDSLAKGPWLLAAACVETPGWRKGHSHQSVTSSPSACLAWLSASLCSCCLSLYQPLLCQCQAAWGHRQRLPGRSQGGEAPQEGPGALPGGDKPSLWWPLPPPLHPQHHAWRPSFLPQPQKMNWVGGSR